MTKERSGILKCGVLKKRGGLKKPFDIYLCMRISIHDA